MIAVDRNFHSGFGSLPLTNSSTKYLNSSAVFGRFTKSLKSSHVHPSMWGADFLGMHVKASVTALIGIGTKAVL